MASALENYVNHTVSIITADGRHIVGTLKGFDQTINLILDESHERVYSSAHGVEQVLLGLYIVRGDNVHLWLALKAGQLKDLPAVLILSVSKLGLLTPDAQVAIKHSVQTPLMRRKGIGDTGLKTSIWTQCRCPSG
uniref:U6 snRNA-associated Sm-like protein LSm8 n=1 Tax=Ixodes ricinus TaxID=34613 RepID=A0A131XZ56_IXORI